MAEDAFPKWDYKEYPKSLPADDLWGQVRRTVYGKPVSEEQIAIIVDAIDGGLKLSSDDALLDIGCGNGALVARLFDRCATCLGVDNSEYLVSIAVMRFASDRHRFVYADAVDFAEVAENPERFTKALCYGVFAYLSNDSAFRLLRALQVRFVNVGKVFIGSIPDPACAPSFYAGRPFGTDELENPQSQIGVWRSQSTMQQMASTCGWDIEFPQTAENFYQAHYRYNAVLWRRK